MSKIKATITYFDLKEFGFYRLRQGKEPEYLDGTIPEVLSSLSNWLDGKQLRNTIPWDTDTNQKRTKVFCRSYKIDPSTNDVVIVLWKAVGDSAGNVHAAYANSDVGSDTSGDLTTSKDAAGTEVIWGQPCYYWIIPNENKVASIRFANSIADIDSLCHYIKAFVDFRGHFPNKKASEFSFYHPVSNREVKVKKFTFEYEDENKKTFSANFKIRTQLYRKASSTLNFNQIAKDVTQIVYRETISAKEDDSRPSWVKMFDILGSAIGNNKPPLSSQRHIEVVVDASPDGDELTELVERYNEKYDDAIGWNNIGLKLGGRNESTMWLNEFVLRDELLIDKIDSEIYTSEQLWKAISEQRQRLINKIDNKAPSETSETNENTGDLVDMKLQAQGG